MSFTRTFTDKEKLDRIKTKIQSRKDRITKLNKEIKSLEKEKVSMILKIDANKFLDSMENIEN